MNILLFPSGTVGDVLPFVTLGRALMERGVDPDDVWISLERNMKCAIGFCGHRQFGPEFVCKDGPVVPYGRVADLMAVNEL